MNKGYRCLSQEALKLIACLTMFIDHLGASVVPMLPFSFMPDLYYACRIIGRLAFPIYAFLIAQGVKHTGREGKYLLRLAVGFLLSELPFDILFKGGFTWEDQNVYLTLLLGAGLLMLQKRVKDPWFRVLLLLPFALVADFFRTDYGGMGVAMIAVFGMTDKVWAQAFGCLVCNCLVVSAEVRFFGFGVPVQLFAVPAMVFIGLYSGRKLLKSRMLQWGFYLFYPVHLLLLWVLQQFLR